MRTLPKYRPYGRSLLRWCFPGALLALLPLASGCIAESGDCPEDISDQDITVSLVIEGGLPSQTRADFTEEEGTLAESYIDINDLYVLAFEIGDDKTVADGNSVLKDIIWSPDAAQRLPESVISSNGSQVLLRTFLSSLDYDTSKPFSIVTIANTKKWLADGDTGFSLTTMRQADADNAKTATKLSDLQKVLSYTKAIGESSPGVSNTYWAPDNATSSGIPLFGIKRTTLTGYDNKFHNSANPYPLGTIWMLRTLAKVEISVDPAGVKLDDDTPLEIESASVITGGWNTSLQLIPFRGNADNVDLGRMKDYDTSGNTGQVYREPDFSSVFSPTPSSGALTMLQTTRTVNGQQIPVFVAYLPEYQLAPSVTGEVRNNIIRVRFKNVTSEFSLAIAPHTNGLPTVAAEVHWQYLLRNYLYRFQISGIQVDEQLTLKWTVCPMDPVTSGDIEFN